MTTGTWADQRGEVYTILGSNPTVTITEAQRDLTLAYLARHGQTDLADMLLDGLVVTSDRPARARHRRTVTVKGVRA